MITLCLNDVILLMGGYFVFICSEREIPVPAAEEPPKSEGRDGTSIVAVPSSVLIQH
jgi:hypothetical protein